MKTGFSYGIVACSKTRVRCVFCGVFIPKASKCIEQHTNGTKHKDNIELMTENAISFADNVLYCRPCNTSLPEEVSITKHIETDDHANWMVAMDDLVDGEFITLDSYLSCEKDEVFCEACNSSINCSLQAIEQHVNHITHRTNIVERLKPINGIFPVDNEYEVWCKVCDSYIENTVLGILSHIDDDGQHMEWFAEIEDLIDGQDVTIEAYLTTEYESKAYCNKCQLEVPCNVQSIESHVHSDAHLNQFSL